MYRTTGYAHLHIVKSAVLPFFRQALHVQQTGLNIHLHLRRRSGIQISIVIRTMPKLKKSAKGKKGAPRAAAPNPPSTKPDSGIGKHDGRGAGMRQGDDAVIDDDAGDAGGAGEAGEADTGGDGEPLLKRHRAEASDEGGPLFVEMFDTTEADDDREAPTPFVRPSRSNQNACIPDQLTRIRQSTLPI